MSRWFTSPSTNEFAERIELVEAEVVKAKKELNSLRERAAKAAKD
jgi:hypothetical protein